ncbi:alpha/beta hydrolase fold domain-containing protein [Haloferula sp.]|uniref:alpha/beta hydrolase fold domain-containing protein n=1 Tax=Haloferula sp. TaxID=2497595 RepID=UPI0032A028BD
MNRPVIFLSLLAATSTVSAQSPEQAERIQKLFERYPEADTNKDGTLTREEARAFIQKRRGDQSNRRSPASKPTHADVSYGDHAQQAFDLWLAKSEDGKPTPLCIYIHGGGFRSGDKRAVSQATIDQYLNAGISFASMNYRLTNKGEFPYPTAMHDSARGLQFIRSKAKEWNLDPERVACFGGSAGAGITLWLAFHDDLADPESDDPIARQSTRIFAAGTSNGQSSYDMRTIRKWFALPELKTESALIPFYNMKEGETFDTPRVAALAEDASPINHLSKDDRVPVHMSYSRPNSPVTESTSSNERVHHALFGLKLQEAMQKLDLECIVVHPGLSNDTYKNLPDFLIKKLTASTPPGQ